MGVAKLTAARREARIHQSLVTTRRTNRQSQLLSRQSAQRFACRKHASSLIHGQRPHSRHLGRKGSRTVAAKSRWSSAVRSPIDHRSEEHTSELQSHSDLVCRLLLEKKK